MKVTGIVPRGYCKGVIRAINIVKETIEQPGPITVLGMIPVFRSYHYVF